jgi:hypothetical protein
MFEQKGIIQEETAQAKWFSVQFTARYVYWNDYVVMNL